MKFIWLFTYLLSAQPPVTKFQPHPAVKVVFAPDLASTPPAPGPHTFLAPGGASGVRLGAESMMAIKATVGKDGKLALSCQPYHSSKQQDRAAIPNKEASHEK